MPAGQRRTMTLTSMEVLRRFIQHVVPRGFVRIRHFGYLANPCRTAHLTLARTLLAQPALDRGEDLVVTASAQWVCPRCGAPMIIGVHLTAARLAVVGLGIDSS